MTSATNTSPGRCDRTWMQWRYTTPQISRLWEAEERFKASGGVRFKIERTDLGGVSEMGTPTGDGGDFLTIGRSDRGVTDYDTRPSWLRRVRMR